MDQDRERLTATELAEAAGEMGIPLGANPLRTIGYYKQIGLLHPKVIQEGSVRRAYYSGHHLIILKIIHNKKLQGLTLSQIREVLESHVYLSDAGRQFIEQFRDEYPDTAFVPGSPISRGEMAFFLGKLLRTGEPEKMLWILASAFVGPKGEPVGAEEFAASPQLGRNQ